MPSYTLSSVYPLTINGSVVFDTLSGGSGTNTFVGPNAGNQAAGTVVDNTAVGYNALNTVGSSGPSASNLNTAIGFSAGYTVGQSTTNCTFVGGLTDVATGAISNSTAIGYGAIITASNQIVLGNGALSEVIPTSITATLGAPAFPWSGVYASDINLNGVASNSYITIDGSNNLSSLSSSGVGFATTNSSGHPQFLSVLQTNNFQVSNSIYTITSNTTLTSADMGKTIIFTGVPGSTISIILPSITSALNESIKFISRSNGRVILNVNNNVTETIDFNKTSVELSNGDTMTLLNCTSNFWNITDSYFTRIAVTGYLNANQSISSATSTQVAWNAAYNDQFSLLNTVTGTFSTSHYGWYKVNCALQFPTFAGVIRASILVNSTNMITVDLQNVTGSANQTVVIPDFLVQLQPSDTIAINAFQNSGSSQNILGGVTPTDSFFTIQRITGWT